MRTLIICGGLSLIVLAEFALALWLDARAKRLARRGPRST
jgi:hypothetical protein